MAALNTIAKEYFNDLCAGIAWLIVWKTGRSWNAHLVHLNSDNTLKPDDVELAYKILESDLNAVILNGASCSFFSDDFTTLQLASWIRHYYEDTMGTYMLFGSSVFPPESVNRSTEEETNSLKEYESLPVTKTMVYQAVEEFAQIDNLPKIDACKFDSYPDSISFSLNAGGRDSFKAAYIDSIAGQFLLVSQDSRHLEQVNLDLDWLSEHGYLMQDKIDYVIECYRNQSFNQYDEIDHSKIVPITKSMIYQLVRKFAQIRNLPELEECNFDVHIGSNSCFLGFDGKNPFEVFYLDSEIGVFLLVSQDNRYLEQVNLDLDWLFDHHYIVHDRLKAITENLNQLFSQKDSGLELESKKKESSKAEKEQSEKNCSSPDFEVKKQSNPVKNTRKIARVKDSKAKGKNFFRSVADKKILTRPFETIPSIRFFLKGQIALSARPPTAGHILF